MTPAQIRSICNQAILTNSYPMIAPEHILAILDSVEGLSLNHPDNTADCSSLALDYQAAIGRVAALQAELNIERVANARLTSETPQSTGCGVTLLSDEVQCLRRDNAVLRAFIDGKITRAELEVVINAKISTP